MHSGNVGHAQDLDTLIRASTFLRDLDDLAVRIIGGGARRERARRARASGSRPTRCGSCRTSRASCRSLSLSSADVHFVGLARGLAGYVVPSRLYGDPRRRAAGDRRRRGRERDGAARRARSAAASSIPPGRPVRCSRGRSGRAHDGEFDLAEMGRRARAFAEAEADRGDRDRPLPRRCCASSRRARDRRRGRLLGRRSPRSSGRTPRTRSRPRCSRASAAGPFAARTRRPP